MKILVLSPDIFEKGGIARYGRYQITALEQKFGKENVRVLSLRGKKSGDLEGLYDVFWHGSSELTLLSRAALVFRATTQVVRWSPDVLWSQHINLGPLAMFLGRLFSIPYIQTIYGREIWSKVFYFRRKALLNCSRVISDCHNTAQKARQLMLVKKPPTVIWDCVDLLRFTSIGKRSPHSDVSISNIQKSNMMKISFLGRLQKDTRYKGSMRLLELLARPGMSDFRGVIAGQGNDLENLKQRALDLGLGSRIEFPGPIPEKELVDFYREADIFYLVSEVGEGMGEGIPLTPIEAMACGAPIIVGNQDGSSELLSHGGGICCAPENYSAQENYCRQLANSQKFYDMESRRAIERAKDEFAFDIFSAKTVDVLDDL